MNFFDTNKINYKNYFKFHFFSVFFFLITFTVGSTFYFVPFLFPKFSLFQDTLKSIAISSFTGLAIMMLGVIYFIQMFPKILLVKIKKDHPLIRKLTYITERETHAIDVKYGYFIDVPLENNPNLSKFEGNLDLLKEEAAFLEFLNLDSNQKISPDIKLSSQQSELILRITSLTSGKESIDLIIAVFAIFFGLFYIDVLTGSNLPFFMLTVVIAISYLGHEIAHKVTGNKNGIYSRYVLSEGFMLFTMFAGLFNLRLAIPGGVKTLDKTTDKRILGKIAFAGILFNIVLIIFGFIFYIFVRSLSISYFYPFFIALMNINIILGILNVIPFFGLDGLKIMRWNIKIWLLSVLTIILLAVLQYFYMHRYFLMF